MINKEPNALAGTDDDERDWSWLKYLLPWVGVGAVISAIRDLPRALKLSDSDGSTGGTGQT